MSSNYLSDEVRTLLVLAGTTALATSTGQDSAEVDMTGYDAVRFTATIVSTSGDGTTTLWVKGSTASGGTFAALSGVTVTSTTGLTGSLLQIDVRRPHRYPYLKAAIARNVAASMHGGIIADLYNAKTLPVTSSASTSLTAAVVKSSNPST